MLEDRPASLPPGPSAVPEHFKNIGEIADIDRLAAAGLPSAHALFGGKARIDAGVAKLVIALPFFLIGED